MYVMPSQAKETSDNYPKALSKVPEITVGFWIIKIAATTLGETGSDCVTMTLGWGYLIGVISRSTTAV